MNAKLVLIPIVALVLTACGGSVTPTTPEPAPQPSTQTSTSAPATTAPEAPTDAQLAAQKIWDGQTSEDHVVTCQMYKSQKIVIKEAIMTANDTYKGKSKAERQLIVDAFFAILDKEC